MISILQFDGSTVSSSDDAILYKTVLSDGILNGCNVSHAGTNINVSAGRILMCGRTAKFDDEQIQANLIPSGELIIKIDMEGGTPAQWATRAPQELIQQDINNGGTIYEIQVATYTADESGIKSITRTISDASTLLDGKPGAYYLNYNNLNNKPTIDSLGGQRKILVGTQPPHEVACQPGDIYIQYTA